ncbi:gustatory receptor isoform X1 [Tribolium castaneum]|uniref:Gustatory receptor n=1 Tax=Tribolium castaneum TaxID=7070 RepID=A2AXB2_TRICA|nr:gustatory receptor [Tribolium castaneum]ABY40618.1 gustatory receptor [Tribolium castaneum]CAL23183.2 gustatory receptor candidate 50 [Tribolium castaneum]|eukprot:NP_001137601.1 gustatory receptor [Tribolium castaneum]
MSLYSSINSLVLISKIFALLPVKKHHRLEKLVPCVYLTSFSVVLSLGSFIVSVYLTTKIDNDGESISLASGWLDLYLGITIQTLGIISNCINAKQITIFFDKIQRIDKQFGLLGYSINYRRISIFVNLAILGVFGEFVLVFVPDYVFFVENEPILYLIFSYCPIVTTGIIKIQFATCAHLILQRVNHVKKILEKETQTVAFPKDNHFLALLDIVHGVHNELCNLCQVANSIYGFQNFLFVLSTFSICITQFYYCYDSGFNSDNLTDVYFTLQWAFLQILEILALAYLCDKVQLKIGEIKYSVNKLIFRSNDPKVTLELCGMISTYLIIMIQLDLARTVPKFENKNKETEQ